MSGPQAEARRRDPAELVALLYQGLADAQRWPAFADAMASFFDSPIAQISIVDIRTGAVELAVLTGAGGAAFQRYKEQMHLDPRGEASLRLLGQAAISRDVIDDETFEATAFYRDVIEPAGAHFCLWVSLEAGPDRYASFAVMRGKERGVYTEDDRALMAGLAPHFREVVRRRHEFHAANAERRIAAAGLDRVAVPMLVLDAEGRVQHRNDAASALLGDAGLPGGAGLPHDAGVLCIADGRLCAARPAETTALHQTLGAALAGGGAPEPEVAAGLLRFTRPADGAPLAGTLVPLRDAAPAPDRVNIQQPLAVLFVADPAHPLDTPPELLQRPFGLTPDDARVLAQLAAGRSLQAIAEQQAVAVGAVERQVASILAGTGADRQG